MLEKPDVEEERLVAELELLGIRYLSRRTPEPADSVRPPETLLADLMRQPSARVRSAVIAVLLAHPDMAEAVPAALANLTPAAAQSLRFFYTAAVLLQQQYAARLHALGMHQTLPQRYAIDVVVAPGTTGREQLASLGRLHRQQTGIAVNWAGTYDAAARHHLRTREAEGIS